MHLVSMKMNFIPSWKPMKRNLQRSFKDEEEDDDEIDVVDDPAEMNQLSQYINKWINPDSDPRFLF